MKENKKDKLTGKEWERLASLFSQESVGNYPVESKLNDEYAEVGNLWKEIGNMEKEKEVDVDKAWNNVYSRIVETDNKDSKVKRLMLFRTGFLKVAAILILLLGSGTIFLLLKNKGSLILHTTITADNESNKKIDLPDGSTVYLNRNSSLSYKPSFGANNRNVELQGEAFFDIARDASNPFIIDAGKANIEVIGTSFNVITENSYSEVEVFVKTGKVRIEDKAGSQSILLDPGFIGKLSDKKIEKSINDNPNYLAWNTGKLVYKGEKLEVVFSDLKRVYNIDIVIDDPSINELPWTAPIDYQPEENIIRMICLSFDLNYTRDGQTYRLSEN
ncbi:MAG TPA: FecR family protein [Bacteroidales bacterium]|nr:FecR family protein [Bacteroidales bacterium]